jgi:hypothetical protein
MKWKLLLFVQKPQQMGNPFKEGLEFDMTELEWKLLNNVAPYKYHNESMGYGPTRGDLDSQWPPR